jgi:hypothetical protein
MGEHRRRLTLTKQRRVGVARQSVKVSLLIDPAHRNQAARSRRSISTFEADRHCQQRA